jgi:hypothetical protein
VSRNDRLAQALLVYPTMRYSRGPLVLHRLALAVGVVLANQGCAGLALPAVGAAAVSGSAGGIVRAGTEYTLSGTAYRTFTLPFHELHARVRETLTRLEFEIVDDELLATEGRLEAAAARRTVKIRLTPVTSAMTQMKVIVKQDPIRKDRATTSEIITQIEQDVRATRPPAAGAARPDRAQR